mmetsp:Transcript_26004/g.70456  ORF Transcript_26004/g.70456 Transcript_26004/m.70456 type:complete len:327 (+) Transcript_26004:117-1097(+)|eukprot:CAMPEP_0202345320 /NCGR_PEP_ID=MMETSP1126-20121109/4617_1 /ASSEMBLY_ACC=CAM_ASM_000457 /TAXON_ID=3047 /ORGANISM="Dunaliella tertiolecta, Strain CCMP1320" /LENGTH=326 /DNA_ID=CAMNT_0048936623 /DNA_START=1276 /DNA_END=2256 /DNA_ORIENTATION=-
MASDEELVEEELCALEAIFGDDCHVNREERIVKVYIPDRNHVPSAILHVHLPPSYPSSCPPVADLVVGPHCPPDLVNSALEGLSSKFVPGEVVLYDWVEWLKEEHSHLYQLPQQQQQQQGDQVQDGQEDGEQGENGSGEDDLGDEEGEEGQKREVSSHTLHQSRQDADLELMEAMRPHIVSGEPNTERKSTFQAHLAPVRSTDEVFAVVAILMENNKVRNATHNIMAYRIYMPEKSTFNQDCDDDGEACAGGRLLHMMQAADARDVVVVVTRWFGGVLLGPQRFALINNTARMLLEAQGYISKSSGTSAAKQAKSKGPQSKLGPKK